LDFETMSGKAIRNLLACLLMLGIPMFGSAQARIVMDWPTDFNPRCFEEIDGKRYVFGDSLRGQRQQIAAFEILPNGQLTERYQSEKNLGRWYNYGEMDSAQRFFLVTMASVESMNEVSIVALGADLQPLWEWSKTGPAFTINSIVPDEKGVIVHPFGSQSIKKIVFPNNLA
jgi:hypothetical protein